MQNVKVERSWKAVHSRVLHLHHLDFPSHNAKQPAQNPLFTIKTPRVHNAQCNYSRPCGHSTLTCKRRQTLQEGKNPINNTCMQPRTVPITNKFRCHDASLSHMQRTVGILIHKAIICQTQNPCSALAGWLASRSLVSRPTPNLEANSSPFFNQITVRAIVEYKRAHPPQAP